VETDEDLDRFIRAVYNVAENQPGWRAGYEAIMQEIGIDDFQRYQELARRCEGIGYISSRANHYALVRITEHGKWYVESDRTEA
jgi:hypothetical protein